MAQRPADVYHAHDLNTLPVAAAAAEKHGVPLIYDAHELFAETFALTWPERIYWRALSGA